MALNIKTSDIGWFYHAPARKKNTEPVIPPPLSQIPGLSNEAYMPSEELPKGRWIKETDSKYIQLAKQGGRQDLLCMVTPEPPSEEPVGYPRAEWYYDQPAQELEAYEDEYKEPYQFMLPDYMVHRPYKPKAASFEPVCPPAPSGVPYRNPVIPEHDGHNGTYSATIQQEPRKSGYGVQAKRASKPSPVKLQSPAYGRTKPPCR